MFIQVKARTGHGFYASPKLIAGALRTVAAPNITLNMGRPITIGRRDFQDILRQADSDSVKVVPALFDKTAGIRITWPRHAINIVDGAFVVRHKDAEQVAFRVNPPGTPEGARLEAAALAQALSFVKTNVSDDDMRPALACVLAEADGETLVLTGCDGFRLAKAYLDAALTGRWLLTKDAVKQLALLLKGQGVVNIVADGQGWIVNGWRLAVPDESVTPSHYPNISGIAPAWSDCTTVTLLASDLATVKGMGKLDSPVARLHVSSEGIELSRMSDGEAEATALIPANSGGLSARIAVNWRYLLQLSKLKGQITLGIKGPSFPMLVKAELGQMIIMPMFVQR